MSEELRVDDAPLSGSQDALKTLDDLEVKARGILRNARGEISKRVTTMDDLEEVAGYILCDAMDEISKQVNQTRGELHAALVELRRQHLMQRLKQARDVAEILPRPYPFEEFEKRIAQIEENNVKCSATALTVNRSEQELDRVLTDLMSEWG
jgi:hypothetical protein